ncbi:MAG: autotransporter domain-containing protein [Alphaproteobacteria bacterium]|nr:autotransporter domain-containing protein [Alphaproteobacteria bacterium]
MTVFKTAGYFVVSTLLVLSSLLKSSKSNAKAQPSRFSRVISFGDSLSDAGNCAKFNSDVNQKGNLPGRASNGTLWVENIFSNLPRENYAYMSAGSSRSLDVLTDEGKPVGSTKSVLGLGHQYDLFRYGVDLNKRIELKHQISNNVIVGLQSKIENLRKTRPVLIVPEEAKKQINQELYDKRLNFLKDLIYRAPNPVDVNKINEAFVKFSELYPAYLKASEELDLYDVGSAEYNQINSTKVNRLRNQASNPVSDILSAYLPRYVDCRTRADYAVRTALQKKLREDLEDLANPLLEKRKKLNEPQDENEKKIIEEIDAEIKIINDEIKKQDSVERINADIEDELANLHKTHAPRSLDPNALYTVWIGMNDLRGLKYLKDEGVTVTEEMGLQIARDTVTNVKSFVNNLIAGGAKFIVVANLPTAFKNPKYTELELEESERLIKYHNIQLHQELVAIASQNKSVNIIPIDMGAVGDEIFKNPEKFGITNVTDYCRKSGTNICADPESYLFWDKYGHLTRKGNELLGQYVEEIIGGSYNVVPQMNATEASAKAASKNVNNRLFALRGANRPLFDSASSLVESHFQQVDSPDGSDIASIMMTSDGVGTALPEMKKNRFVRRAQAPIYGASKKNYFPSLSSDASMGKFGIFAAGDLHLGNQRNTEESTGYRHSTKTITIGGDYKFADYFLAGIAMSYIKSDVRLKDHKGSIDINGYAFSLYDSLKWRQFYLDTVFTYGWNQNKIRNNIVSFKRTGIGEPLGRHWSVGGLAGYDFKLGNLYFGPTAGMAYGDARIHKYKEEGAGVFNRVVGKQRSSTAVSTLGGHISYKMNTFIGEVTPQIRSSYDHEFIDRSRIVVTELASMPGIPYSIPVKNNDHNYGRIGGGLNIRFKNDLSIDLNYETIFARRKARDHFIFGKLRFVF